jgi:NADPH:quinone reductase-like Zn-dependent oxidoreductase
MEVTFEINFVSLLKRKGTILANSIVLTGNDAEPENGAFARLISVKGDIQMHIPDGVSFEAACTVGCGIATTGFGLYKVLNLPLPDTNPRDSAEYILIYGGSTATGTLAIQFAKL